MLRGHGLAGPDHLQTNELVAPLLETLDNISDEAALDGVGLAGEEGPLLVGSRDSVDREASTLGRGDGELGGAGGGEESSGSEGSSDLAEHGCGSGLGHGGHGAGGTGGGADEEAAGGEHL